MLKDLCSRHGYDLSQPDHHTDDTALLSVIHHLQFCSVIVANMVRRYLRAKDFDPAAAFEQFDFATKWREEHRIKAFYDNLDVHSYEESRRMVLGPSDSILHCIPVR